MLKTPKGEQTRPTLGIVRKAVFDILQDTIEGSCFLDLFAGSGAIGIEALSRGASTATFVDSHRSCVECLLDNVKALSLGDQAQVIGYDALLALKTLLKKGKSFDIVYIDPPYAVGKKGERLVELLQQFDETALLKEGGTLFLEEGTPATVFPAFSHLQKVSSRTFSQTVLHEFTYVSSHSESL